MNLNAYTKAIVAALGSLGAFGLESALDGTTTSSTITGIVGIVTTFLVWLVENKPLIEKDIAAVEDLVSKEKAVGKHEAPPTVADVAAEVTPIFDTVASSFTPKVSGADQRPAQ